MIVICLVRHGEVPSNNEPRKHIGQRDDEDLTDNGKRQSQAVAELLKNEPFTVIYASPLKRAVSTAEIIANYHAGKKLTVDQRLIELNLGVFDGKFEYEVASTYAQIVEQRLKDKFGFRIPEGESYQDLVGRLTPFANEVFEKHIDESVCVVGHQGSNRALLKCFLGYKILSERIPYLTIGQSDYIRITKTESGIDTVKIAPGIQTSLEGMVG